jgi:ABC-2 type transport system permease protein
MLRKELLLLRRNPALFRMALFLPLFQTLILSYAANMDVINVPVVVWDADRSQLSDGLVDRIRANPTFHLVGLRRSQRAMDDDLDGGRASLAVSIPPHFGRDMERHQATLQVLADGTESTITTVAMAYLAQLASQYGARTQRDFLDRRGQSVNLGQLDSEPRVFYNPDLCTLWYMAPAIMALVLTILMQNLTALSIARERELGTLEQLVMTPIRPFELLLGKLLPFAVLGCLDATLVATIVVFGLKVPFRGSALLLAGATGLFLFGVLGLGLLVSTVSANQQQAQLTNFLLSYPSTLLSGFIFPTWNLPPLLARVSQFVPMTHYLEITRGVFLRGSSVATLWPHLAWLAGLAVLFFGLGVMGFHKRLE